MSGSLGDSPSDTGAAGGEQDHAQADEPEILWIDDEISPKDDAVLLLQLEGFRVHCAATATAGLAMVRTGRYQGIVLDLRLPDMSGMAVLATLRSEGIATPILMLSGFADFESVRVAGRLGVDAFEAKPLFGDDLIAAVHRLIDRASSETAIRNARSAVPDDCRPALASLATLLEVLHRLSEKWKRHREDVLPGYVRKGAGDLSALVNEIRGDLDLPIVDRTGLNGTFEWELTSEMPGIRELASSAFLAKAPTLDIALKEQLGLRLVKSTAPLKVLVIESVEMPSPN